MYVISCGLYSCCNGGYLSWFGCWLLVSVGFVYGGNLWLGNVFFGLVSLGCIVFVGD